MAESDDAEIVRLRAENDLMRKALAMIQERAAKRDMAAYPLAGGGGAWAAGVAEQCFVQLGWIKPAASAAPQSSE